jgi:hypothetical protein
MPTREEIAVVKAPTELALPAPDAAAEPEAAESDDTRTARQKVLDH